MKVFLSWSGVRSRHIAETLRAWLPRIIQAVKPWMSDVDIPAGARWQTDIAHELDAADFGIICVTPENMAAPWLLFEAGALSKSMKASRVCPLAYSIELGQLSGPIAQFQANKLDQHGIFQVLKAINAAMLDKGLDADHLADQFGLIWNKLEEAINSIPHYEAPKKDLQASIPILPEDVDEIVKLIKSISGSSYKNQSAKDDKTYSVAERELTYCAVPKGPPVYAPVSTLEGAIVGVTVKCERQRDFGNLIDEIRDDLDLWTGTGASVPTVHIDLSDIEILSDDYLEPLAKLGGEFPNTVEIGLSERQIVRQTEVIARFASEIEARMSLAIRDYATGYSSTAYLKELPINSIWISSSFIETMMSDPNDMSIVHAIAQIAKHLNLVSIADGVSNAQQSEMLLKMDVKTIAGSMAGDVMSSGDVYRRIST